MRQHRTEVSGHEMAWLDDDQFDLFKRWLKRLANRRTRSWNLSLGKDGVIPYHGYTYRMGLLEDRIAYTVARNSVMPDGKRTYCTTARVSTGYNKVDWTGRTIRELAGNVPNGCEQYPQGYVYVDYCSNAHMADLVYQANYEDLHELLDDANLIGGSRHESEYDEPQTVEHCPFYLDDGHIYLNLDVRVYGDRAMDLEEMLEAIAGLENYPLIGDETHSNMEWERWEEYVRDCAGREFQREIIKRTDPHLQWDIEQVTDDYDHLVDSDELHACIQAAEVYNEYGDECYINNSQWDAIVTQWQERNGMAIKMAGLLAGQEMTDDHQELHAWLRNRNHAPTPDEPELFSRLYYNPALE